MKKTSGFGLLGIIIIMIITAIVSSIATGVIMLNSTSEIIDNNGNVVSTDEDLLEFIEVYETIVSKYYDEVDTKGMLEAAEEGMLNFLGDKYTTYLEDSEYSEILEELASTYDGIGIMIENNKIISITKDSPAEKVGLEENDLLIKINGTDVTSMNASSIGELIKNSDSSINIIVNRNGVELNFNVEKAKLVNQTIVYQKINNTNIGYLQIKIFSENLEEQVSKALKSLENDGITSLIIDVRDNVGGYLVSAEETASLFLREGKVIYSLETNNNTLTYKDKTNENRDYSIVVLINGNTASASEILASALKESYGATLVGMKSYGKGLVQQVASLNSGDSVKVSTAKWLTPNGTCVDKIGISPDYTVVNNNITGEDYQLQKAIELLS